MIRKILITALLATLGASAMAASTEEAAKLGKTLTPVGAEKAGNKEGTIPEWTGGLTQIPADFKAGSGVRPDPYAADKPRLVITGKNADEFKGQLTAVTYALLKRYPTMRVDVYPTRRPVVYPEEDPGEHRKECDAGQDDGRWPRHRERVARLSVPDPEDRQRGDVESPAALPGRCDDVQIRFVQYRFFRHGDVVHHGDQLPGVAHFRASEHRHAAHRQDGVLVDQAGIHGPRAPRR